MYTREPPSRLDVWAGRFRGATTSRGGHGELRSDAASYMYFTVFVIQTSHARMTMSPSLRGIWASSRP